MNRSNHSEVIGQRNFIKGRNLWCQLKNTAGQGRALVKARVSKRYFTGLIEYLGPRWDNYETPTTKGNYETRSRELE